MSAGKSILLALAASYAALAAELTTQAEALEGGDAPAPAPAKPAKAGKGTNAPAPAPKAAVGGAKGKGGKKAPAVDFDTLKTKLMDSIVKGMEDGKDIAIACLDRFGAQKLGEIAEDQYAEFDAYLDSVIAGDTDPRQAENAEDAGGDDLL
jgi:hypothetical protein